MGQSGPFVRESILDPEASIAAGYHEGVMPTTYGSHFTSQQIDALVASFLRNRK
jgi:hypothetical protein